MLKRHAKALTELAPPDAAGKPRTRVFLFAETMRELPATITKDWTVYSGYPGGADEYAKISPDPKTDLRLGAGAPPMATQWIGWRRCPARRCSPRW